MPQPRLTEVLAVERLTPRMVRVVVGGDGQVEEDLAA